MFSDSNADDRESINCPSNWKMEKKVANNECQTDANKFAEQATQVAFYEDEACQTDKKKDLTAEDAQNPLQDPKFYKFIMKAVPMLEAELEAAMRSRAFDGYELLEAETDSQVRKLHTLDAAATRTRDEGLKVSAISWSQAGSIIAVAFEAEDHEDWCDHPGSLQIWNINRRDFDPGNPYKILQVSACLTCAKFHPVEPGLVAAGGFSGEIYVWNALSDSDPLLASSGVGSIHGHKDKITTVNWISASHLDSRSSRNTFYILSTGLDGILILWSLDLAKNDLNPVRKMMVDQSHLPRTSGVRKKTDIGITCLSTNLDDNSLVIFGTESGTIFEGSLTNPTVLHLSGIGDDEMEWNDPIKVTFQGHHGRVNDLQFSPFDRNLFLSCGSDQQIRIYTLLHPYAPIFVIQVEETSASALSWSFSRPLVFAAGCQNHKLLIYDLKHALKSKMTAPLELRGSEKLIPFPLTSIAFNGKNQGLMAAGDGFGRVHIWKLSPMLMSKNPDEPKILAELGNIQDE